MRRWARCLAEIFVLLFLLRSGLAYAQQPAQSQVSGDDFNYKVEGLVYVNEFDIVVGKVKNLVRIPLPPLKFNVVGKVTVTDSGAVNDPIAGLYYIIKFGSIADEQGAISYLKNNDIYVNSKNSHKYFAVRKEVFDEYLKDGFMRISYVSGLESWRATYGANFSVPFKYRFSKGDENSKINTDVVLGGYAGVKFRLSDKKNYYLSPVATLGLAVLPINDNTAPSEPSKGDGTVLGITAAVGLVLEFEEFQLGVLVGADEATGELGENWIYNREPWVSFSIGYAFLSRSDSK